MKLIKSPNPAKKYRAVFSDGKHTDFGDAQYEDYTEHRDKERRENYRKRHVKDLARGSPRSAGYLSYHLLWGPSTSLRFNKALFESRFSHFL